MSENTIIADLKRGYFMLPQALRVILSINIVVFFVSIFGLYGFFLEWFGYKPNIADTLTQPWRIFTYAFIHSQANPFHIVFNMLILWFFGKPVEQHIGTKSFISIYFFAAIGGALIHLLGASLTGSGLGIPVIGASGAVMGISVAFAFLFPNMQVLFIFIPMPAKYLVALFVLLDFLFLGSGDNVARLVHIGGAATAFLIMYYRTKGYDAAEVVEVVMQAVKPKSKNATRKTNTRMHKVEEVEIVDDIAQQEIDRILDKISKLGYEGLTKEEKKTLFELSKRK